MHLQFGHFILDETIEPLQFLLPLAQRLVTSLCVSAYDVLYSGMDAERSHGRRPT